METMYPGNMFFSTLDSVLSLAWGLDIERCESLPGLVSFLTYSVLTNVTRTRESVFFSSLQDPWLVSARSVKIC